MVRIPDKTKPMKVAVPTPGGEIYLILRRPTDEELDIFRRAQVKQRLDGDIDFDEQAAFVDKLLDNCENVESLDGEPINAETPNWKTLIERDWKLAVVPVFLYPSARAVGNGAKKAAGDPANF